MECCVLPFLLCKQGEQNDEFEKEPAALSAGGYFSTDLVCSDDGGRTKFSAVGTGVSGGNGNDAAIAGDREERREGKEEQVNMGRNQESKWGDLI